MLDDLCNRLPVGKFCNDNTLFIWVTLILCRLFWESRNKCDVLQEMCQLSESFKSFRIIILTNSQLWVRGFPSPPAAIQLFLLVCRSLAVRSIGSKWEGNCYDLFLVPVTLQGNKQVRYGSCFLNSILWTYEWESRDDSCHSVVPLTRSW